MPMTWTPVAVAPPTNSQNGLSDARRQVEAYCQSLVEIGEARWWINDTGCTELHLESGEAYLFDEQGVTRVK
jgi:hypothetical protein